MAATKEVKTATTRATTSDCTKSQTLVVHTLSTQGDDGPFKRRIGLTIISFVKEKDLDVDGIILKNTNLIFKRKNKLTTI